MKKFEICTDHFEIRTNGLKNLSAKDIFDLYRSGSVLEEHIEESFDTLEEARSAFDKTYSKWARTSFNRSSVSLLSCDVVFIVENNYDDETGDFDFGGDVWEYAAEPYSAKEDDE